MSDNPTEIPSEITWSQFLISAGIVEGGLLLVAFGGGWLTGCGPLDRLEFNARDLGLGVLATFPMLVLLVICLVSKSSGMLAVRRLVRNLVGPILHRCRMIDIVLLALLAGICEEAAFRGFLYFWIERWNPFLAVFIVNLLFAAAHAVTPTYALLSGFLGLYLTALVASDATPNLLIPITAHALYDFAAFLVVRADYRRHGLSNVE
ncbi:MAG: CPBP family intramembrane metalloprotease [Planctomycetaceae bacterium]|nr:CPBP family intramembrane metalloprotease [Planctomycetaceae bacterium]